MFTNTLPNARSFALSAPSSRLAVRLLHLAALLVLALLVVAPFSASVAYAASPVSSGDWFLLLDEQFSGSTLDTSKWHTCYWWISNDPDGCTNRGNNELEWYQPDEVILQDGLLRLRAQQRSMNGFNYTSGMISSDRGFYFQYGYLEVRARVPRGQGLWPAVWLLPNPESGWPPEIDVLEVLGHDTTTVHMTRHYKDATTDHGQDGGSFTGPDFAEDFHIFAVDWQPDSITWYVDNVEQFRVTTHVPQEPMHILANLAVGGNWPGSPDETTMFPSYYDIDYIRVWQRPEHFLSN